MAFVFVDEAVKTELAALRAENERLKAELEKVYSRLCEVKDDIPVLQPLSYSAIRIDLRDFLESTGLEKPSE